MGRLTNFLIATEENNYIPGILKPRSLLVIALVFTILELGAFVYEATTRIEASDLTPEVILEAVNKERSLRNIPLLVSNDKLSAAAIQKSNDMINRKYFSHTDPEGDYIWPTIVAAGYSPYKVLGENLAIEFTSTESMINAWMNSPTHRANIVNESFADQGMGVAFGNVPDGQYYSAVTNTFGALLATKSAPAPTSAKATTQQTPKPEPKSPTQNPIAAAPKPAKPTPQKTLESQITQTPPPLQNEPEISKPAPALSILSQTLDIKAETSGEIIRISMSVRVTGSPSVVTARVDGSTTGLIPGEKNEDSQTFTGTLILNFAPDLQDQLVEIIARDTQNNTISYQHPLKYLSFGRSDFSAKQLYEAVTNQLDSDKPTSAEETAGVRPVAKNTLWQTVYKFNRYISLIFGLLLIGFLLTDVKIIVEKKLRLLDKRLNNIFVLALSLIVIALLYWL